MLEGNELIDSGLHIKFNRTSMCAFAFFVVFFVFCFCLFFFSFAGQRIVLLIISNVSENLATKRICDVKLTKESAEEFQYAVQNHYWFQLYLGSS